ncbi:hypothetical protein FLONG3_8510 [Fusarium longipes]|uniref:Annexin anxc4 n=1 Tax=Fusarium longipes TaxID=694270 RepID=A0A395S5R5_9HYPO|nr:hypothetical protein FLONG3_8510 [Fusarium longipes]
MSSLRPDDRSRKDRSRSRSRDRRSKSDAAPERPSYSDYREPSYIYPEDDLNDRTRPGAPQASGALPYPDEGGIYSMLPGNQEQYSYDSYPPTYRTASPPKNSPYRSSHDRVDSNLPGAFPDDSRREKDRDPYSYSGEPRAKDEQDKQDRFSFLPQKYMRKLTGSPGDNKERDNRSRKDKLDDDLAYGQPGVPPRPKAEADDLAYGRATGLPSTASQVMTTYNPPPTSGDDYYAQQSSPYGYNHRDPASPSVDQYGSRKSKEDVRYNDTYGSNANVLTVEPRSRDDDKHRERRRDRSSDPRGSSDRLTVDSSGRRREKSRDRSRRREKSRDRSRSHRREKSGDTLTVDSHHRHRSRSRDGHHSRKDRSPKPPTERMSGLSINTGLTVGGLTAGGLAGASLANAPASPMLESYYGTYQDCSPMPSPLLLAAKSSDDNRALEALSPLGSDNEDDSRRRSRRARFHDPEDITTQLAQALKGSRKPDTEPLIEILPSLTHDQVMKLRTDYKAIVKTGSERKGVNIAKHIRSRLKDEDPLLMKACYSVALGMWESEAYWANFWYQGDKTRRELLIESLMGRTNAEIRYIKDAFTDKKYDNSLTKCMKEELKEDKFKKAVLLVLEERRMEEYDHYGRLLPIDYALVDQDVADLRRSIKSERGGETAMINIIVLRSDSHLRAILQEYERQYRANFARDALKKSGNLVGELLAHILNGVINRPVRDALLIHHATSASRKDGLRRELLISRLVRYHWDPHHMRAVKQAYRERYGRGMRDAVRDATSGEWGEFCGELCIARMPDDVRKFDKVSYSTR